MRVAPPRTASLIATSPSGPHRITYREWSQPDAERTVVCVHGLTGCSRDFDVLAPTLADAGYRVVCPDVVGRGDSDRLSDCAGYELRQYVSDMRALLDHLGAADVDWIGTSMGGLIGMALAAAPDTRLRRLVLNDIGPFIPTAALQRLGMHVGADPIFPTLAAAEAHLRVTRAPFGTLTEEQWRSMAERTTRPEAGGYRLHYDPAVAVRFRQAMRQDVDLWRIWDSLRRPVLVLRGEASDFLSAKTAKEMTARGPGATIIEFAGCGHTPPLLERSQIDPIVEWLGLAEAE